MNSIDAILSVIPEKKSVHIDLPLIDSNNKLRLGCVFQPAVPPSFKLLFPVESIGSGQIDMHRKCTVLVDMGGQSISLTADIDAIENEQEMRLIARDFTNHKSGRDFFRVDIRTPLVVTSLIPPELSEQEPWQLTGETLDLSGSGLLATFPNPIEHDKRLRLNLVLPSGDASVVPIVAHAIRSRKVEDNQYQVAFCFDQISSEDQDRIVASCFEIQRKHIRLNV